MVRRILLALVCAAPLALASCIPTRLGDPAKGKVDPALTGIWLCRGEKPDFGDDESGMVFQIAPVDDRQYVVHAERYGRTAGAFKLKATLGFRAWITAVGGKQFLSLEPVMEMADPRIATPQRTYFAGRLTLADDVAVYRAIGDRHPAIKNAKTPEQLLAAVEANIDDKLLYIESMTFRRLDPTKADDKAYLTLSPK